MSKKITISVPDELYDKMKEWKSSFNFSQVFQNAMTGLIKKKEAFRKRVAEDFDFASIVSRLKEEKIEVENNFQEAGKNDGFKWCTTAHYSDLRYALTIIPGENLFNDEKLGDYFSATFERYKKVVTAKGILAQNRFNDFTRKYVEGWKEGVEYFWSEVKDKI